MLRNLVRKTAVLASLFPLILAVAHAAVTVTGVKVIGTGAPYDVAYVLNTGAASGQVEILNASNQVVYTAPLAGAALSRGTHHFLWDGKTTGGATVPSGNYRARVTASGDAVAEGGAKLWGPLDTNSSSATPVRYGIAVNRNVGSPYYGRIYVCDYSGDSLIAYNADGTQVMTLTGSSGNPYYDFMNGIRDAYVGQDDRIYVAVQTDNTTAGILSMKQDGTDVIREVDLPNQSQSRSLAVTMSGDTKRFYVSYSTSNSHTAGPGAVAVITKTAFGPEITVILSPTQGTDFAGLVDDIVVLDSFNDPVGHPGNATIYARHNQVGAAGVSTVIRWDSDADDPTFAVWSKNATFNPGTLAFGRGLSLDPDGNLWTALSAAAIADRGYVKLNKTTGAQMAKINVPNGDGKPRLNDTDHKGNLIGLTIGEAVGSTYAKYLLMYAPESGPTTDATTSDAFAVSGIVLPPITISNLAVTDRTSRTATIEWDTNVTATSEVNYGPTNLSIPNLATGPIGTHHRVVINGLTPTSTVYYKVRSAAEGYATDESDIRSFVTKDVLTISNVQVSNVTGNSAKVTWTTEQPAGKATNSVVRYGTSPDAVPLSATGNTDAENHSVTLTGLTGGTAYYFVVESGSSDVETTTSRQFSFATVGADGRKVRKIGSAGDFKFGLLNDVMIDGQSLRLNRKGIPDGVDDAGVPDLPEGAANHAVVAYGGYLYKIGGRHPSVNKDTVYVAAINANGSVAEWRETSRLPDPRYFLAHGGFGYNGYVYVVAGGVPEAQMTTLYARQNPLDGSLGPWAVAGAFPEGAANARDAGAVAVHQGRVYYTAGENNTTAVATTLIADIKADGTLTEWNLAMEEMPQARAQHAAGFRNGNLYVWGGATAVASPQTPVTSILRTMPASATPPELSGWTVAGPDLTNVRVGFAGGILNGNALMIGGSDGSARTNRISYAPFNADGTMDAFADASVIYPAVLRDMDGAAWQGRYYVLGGRSGDGSPTYDTNAQPFAAAVTFSDSGAFVRYGRYESAVMDLNAVEPLASLSMGATGAVSLSYRTAAADGVFGPWTTVSGAASNFNNVSARYVQFALDLTSDGTAAAKVDWVALSYGAVAPQITLEDVRDALKIGLGGKPATAEDMARLNANGDSAVTLEDAVSLLRQRQGL